MTEHGASPREQGESPKARRSLADAYLTQACDALRASGSSDTLYGRNARESKKGVLKAAGRALAPGRRVGFSRTAILFAALACEAFVNEFLDEHLHGSDLDAVDRLPTLEKYVLGPRLAIGADLFPRGEEPAQSIRELFRLRDRLVHSKPREVPARGSIFDDPHDFDTYNPEVAAGFIVAVARAASRLSAESSEPLRNFTVLAIFQAPHVIENYGREASTNLPSIEAAPQDDLVLEAVRKLTGRSPDYVTPRGDDPADGAASSPQN